MPWMRSPSPTASPIGVRGSRLANGSWKTICALRRYDLSCDPLSLVMSTPSKRTEPPVGSISRRMSRPTVVLPQPDSPTSPSVSPARTSKSTPSTARTWPTTRCSAPARTGKVFASPRTSSSGALLDTSFPLARAVSLITSPPSVRVRRAQDRRGGSAHSCRSHRCAQGDQGAARCRQRGRSLHAVHSDRRIGSR